MSEEREKQAGNTTARDDKGLWLPGKSANPDGRPKKGNAWADVYNSILDSNEISLTLINGDDTEEINIKSPKNTIRYALGVALAKEALAGNINAIKELSDRTVGKAPQTLTVKDDIEDLDAKLGRLAKLVDETAESNGINEPLSDSEGLP